MLLGFFLVFCGLGWGLHIGTFAPLYQSIVRTRIMPQHLYTSRSLSSSNCLLPQSSLGAQEHWHQLSAHHKKIRHTQFFPDPMAMHRPTPNPRSAAALSIVSRQTSGGKGEITVFTTTWRQALPGLGTLAPGREAQGKGVNNNRRWGIWVNKDVRRPCMQRFG